MGCTNNALAFFAISARNVAITKKMSQGFCSGVGEGGYPSPSLYQSSKKVPCLIYQSLSQNREI